MNMDKSLPGNAHGVGQSKYPGLDAVLCEVAEVTNAFDTALAEIRASQDRIVEEHSALIELAKRLRDIRHKFAACEIPMDRLLMYGQAPRSAVERLRQVIRFQVKVIDDLLFAMARGANRSQGSAP